MSNFNQFWKAVFRIEKKLTDDQLDSVQEDIARLQAKGQVSSKIINYLMRKYPADLGEQWQAERAYWTEVKRMESTMVKQDAKALGIEKFRIMPNTGACPICIKFSQNGQKIFSQKGLLYKGRTVPPIHPGCFCIVLPVID